MRVIQLSGSPAAMGEAFGAALRAETAELYRRRLANAQAQALRFGRRRVREDDLLALAGACLGIWECWDAAGVAELRGIARGAGLSPERVVALGGLTDLRDALAWGAEPPGDCTAALVQRDASGDGHAWLAQTWDLPTDNAPFVVGVHRRPAHGPETWALTTAGGLSVLGMNAHGLAVGTTNLRTLDARPGVPYAGVLHAALAEPAADAALDRIASAPRAGGHVFLLVSREGRAAALECSARHARTLRLESGFHVHTNHCLLPEHRALEADTPRESSKARRERMAWLLQRGSGGLDAARLELLLGDRANGKLSICRDDADGISTLAAFVCCPARRLARACCGQPAPGRFVDLLAAEAGRKAGR